MFKPAVITFLVAGVIGCGFDPPPATVLPEISFAVDQSLTDESIANTQLLLKLSMRSPEPVTVRYEVTGGTATVGRDLNNAEGEVIFEAFQDTAVIALAIVDDGLEEEEENVKVTLKEPKGAKLGPQIDHTLRISANKLPRVRFVSAASTAGEETGVQTFAVQLDTLSPVDVVVRYSWSGTSEPGDHGLVDGFVTIRAGQLSQPLLAPVVNDPTDEDDETIDLALIAQDGGVVAPGLGQHVHTIVDDDPPPAVLFSAAASAATEGTATATLQVSLALASEKPITVQYADAGGGTASPDDFTITPGTLTFEPGTTTLTVPVTIASDTLDEDDETVRAQLMNPTNATLQAADGLHTLTITDDDNPPTIEFQQASSTAAEGTATHSIGVKLSAPSGKTIQFSISRSGTSTTDDLTLPAATFTIPPGATTLSIDATVIDDADDDNDETAVLTLDGLVNVTAAGARQTHTVTITDNDVSVRFDPGVGDKSGSERHVQTTTYSYRVRLSEASTSTVTVDITLGGTASDDDFDIGAGDIPVVFSPGQTAKDIDVIIRPDFTLEPDETITLTIGSITSGVAAADNQTRTHTIVNDDN